MIVGIMILLLNNGLKSMLVLLLHMGKHQFTPKANISGQMSSLSTSMRNQENSISKYFKMDY
jgi:hypothetical protein